MVKKRSSFAQHGPYLAIVAVVAVVAIVFLILNFAGISSTGEAVRVARTASAPDPCREGERCGFVTETEINNLIKKFMVVDFSTITKHYLGNTDWRKKSAQQVCTDLGYTGCFIGEYRVNVDFFQSDDTTCTGLQHDERFLALKPCSSYPTIKSDCFSPSQNPGGTEEPESGDFTSTSFLESVICIE